MHSKTIIHKRKAHFYESRLNTTRPAHNIQRAEVYTIFRNSMKHVAQSTPKLRAGKCMSVLPRLMIFEKKKIINKQ